MLTKMIHAQDFMGLPVCDFLDELERDMEIYDELYIYFPDWTLYDEAIKTVRRWCLFRLEEGNRTDYLEEYYWKKA